MKGQAIHIDMGRCVRVHPAVADEARTVKGSGDRLEIKDKKIAFLRLGGGGVVAMMENRFDLARGVVIEGNMTVLDEGWGADTHIIPVSVGFCIEEAPGEGMAVCMETYGITRIGRLDWREGKPAFTCLDVTGPGCASPGGILEGRKNTFRLLVRRDILELYLNDLLVQTFFFSAKATGRIGFLAQDGGCLFEDVKVTQMSLPGE
ncbi:MAG: hypothetical protein NT031_16390 [Planctomycetota bacterium]|nr:hypothetical protein [Planctomycetota bacterium]